MYEDAWAMDPSRLIAVVGMAGRFPEAPDVEGFWRLLCDGGDAIGPVPPDRWDAAAQLDPEKAVQDVGGFLDGVDAFDPTFFGISPREAADIDPQQRLMLEVAWQALEDGGRPAADLRGSRTGVYVGASWHDYEILRKERGAPATQHSAVGNALDVIAARVSYFLGLVGPSLVVETGCSSSLVALHLAGQALRAGDIGAALVGGVNLILAPDVSIGLTHFGGLSPRGRCHAFADGADGFVRAECVGALYLKRLDRALADGDTVRGVIAATAVNNDGGGDSLVTPNPRGQEDLLRHAYETSGVPLDKVRYLEAHGTGTDRGDPVEAGAIGRILGRPRDPAAGPLPIGSVKSNIGHAEASAGLAGLIKALLVLQHRLVPPTLHAERLNPDIDFESLNLRVVREPLPLPADEQVFAGVNSFGWGGTNAHVVVTDVPSGHGGDAGAGPEPGTSGISLGGSVPPVVPVSAHSPQALAQRIEDVRELVAGGADHAEVAGALALRRDHFPHRVGVVAPDAGTLVRRLSDHRADPGADIPGLAAGRAGAAGRVAFVFPGQGSQWAAMGRRLQADHAGFAATIERCARALKPHVDWDLAEIVSGAAGDAWMSRVDIVQPALWAVSVGLAGLWRDAGVTPDVVAGQSQGEVAAATVAGILSPDDAAMIIARRSAIAARTSGRGRMLAVGLDADGARAALAGFEDSVSLAVDNGPGGCVLSGETEAVLFLKELLDADGVFCRLVEVDYASHSPQMDELTEDLLEALDGVAPSAGDIPLMSTVRAALLDGAEMGAGYWVENLREPVLFQDALTGIFDGGVTHVVEVSPHPVLATVLEQLAEHRAEPPRVLATLRRDAGGPDDLALAFAQAYAAGLEPFGGLPSGAAVRLPAYPWQRSGYWPRQGGRRTSRPAWTSLPLVPSPSEQGLWQGTLELGLDDHPWLEDHRVHDAVVVPGTATLTLALAAGRSRGDRTPAALTEIEFRTGLALTGEPAHLGALWRDDVTEGGSFSLLSLAPDGVSWTAHTTARVHHTAAGPACPPFPGDRLTLPPMEADEFYAACGERGLRYGPAFRGVQRVHAGDGGALAELRLPPRCNAGAAHGLHPALWDAALQAVLAVSPGTATVVPSAIERVDVHAETAEPVIAGWSYALRRPDGLHDVHLYDEARGPVLSMTGVALTEAAASADRDPHADRVYRMHFLARPRDAAPGAASGTAGRWLVCGDDTRVGSMAAALDDAVVPAVPGDVRLRAEDGLTGVVFLAPAAERGLAAQRDALSALAGLVRSARSLPTPPRLAVVTTDAQAVVPADVPDAGAALFWGFTRVLRREHGELAPVLLDVAARDGGWAARIAAELAGGAGDDQVVLRGGERFAGRIRPAAAGDGPAADPDEEPAWRVPAQPFRLVPVRPGRWDGLRYRPLRRMRPAAGEVEVEVSAAALNFIDVMKAMGTYPDPAGGALLGGECAGRVVEVGDGVTGLRVGDRVVACDFGALASHRTLDASRVRPIPDGLDDATAAALPLAAITAWYGLAELAGLGRGETVLIHSAAGGLGLAAIGIARHLGARVLATAGSEEKRRYLRELGVDHVFDSRDLSWAREVMAATGGRGVDVVLNSLTGAAIGLGLDVLAEDGRFIEVGKMDIYADRTVSLGAFRKGISLASVDLAGLMRRRPERFGRLLTEVWDLVRAGDLPRPPVREHTFADAPEALRTMARGTHIGKFVLTEPASVESVAPEPMPDGAFRPDGTYLITGGLGALGLSLAEFIAGRGGGALALLGRTPPGEAAAARLAALRERGVDVQTHQVDITDRAALAGALDGIRARMPQLRGVVHAAGVLDDATVANLTPAQIERVISPKLDGARHLDELTAADPLDLFVLFSSAAALVGNAGQAAYAAGNAYLDALAEARRRRGLPGLSVQWGPFAEIGLAAADGDRGDRLADRGMDAFPAGEAWDALARFLDDGESVAAYVRLDLRRWFDANPETAALPGWQELRDGGRRAGGTGAGGFLDELRDLPADAREAHVENRIRELTGRVLRMDPDAIDRDTPFKALGLDSLLGLELRNRLEAAFDLRLSPTLLWTYGSAGALTEVLHERLDPDAPADEQP